MRIALPRNRQQLRQVGGICFAFFFTTQALAQPGERARQCKRTPNQRSSTMIRNAIRRAGNLRWGLIALLLGLPLPIVLLIWLFVGR